MMPQKSNLSLSLFPSIQTPAEDERVHRLQEGCPLGLELRRIPGGQDPGGGRGGGHQVHGRRRTRHQMGAVR